jgi:predicted nuclease with TOPRIM domain
MQQDLEDKKHEVIIEGLESKIKDQAAALEKKDFELQTTEGLLAEAEAKVAKLNTELLSKSESFEQEKQKLNAKLKTNVEKSSNLQKSLTELQNKCLEFSSRCVQRLNRSSIRLEPAAKNLVLWLKTCQGPSNISRVKLMTLMKL